MRLLVIYKPMHNIQGRNFRYRQIGASVGIGWVGHRSSGPAAAGRHGVQVADQ